MLFFNASQRLLTLLTLESKNFIAKLMNKNIF